MGASVVYGGNLVPSQECGNCDEGEQITTFLVGNLQETDRVVATCPCDIILEYYFKQRSLSLRHFTGGEEEPERAFVIVNRNPIYAQTLESNLRFHGMETIFPPEKAKLIVTFGQVDIYLVERNY